MNSLRIVSVVPSQTELLFDLGLADEIVGVTKFCIHPSEKISSKIRVGGTKTLDLASIRALQPTLILANKEENTRDQIEALQQQYAVHVTDVATLPQALTMIRDIGKLVGKIPEADAMARQIESSFQPVQPAYRPTVAYFIWRKPYMVAANDTFIHAMLELAGFQNAFAQQTRYPAVTPEAFQSAQPDLIFLSSEPYPFARKHIAEFQTLCPSAKILLVDGEMFSWYGSRLLRALNYFRNLRDEIFLK